MPRFNIGDRVKVRRGDNLGVLKDGAEGVVWPVSYNTDAVLVRFSGEDAKWVQRKDMLHTGSGNSDDLDCWWILPHNLVLISPISKEERLVAVIHRLNNKYSRHMESKGLKSCLDKG